MSTPVASRSDNIVHANIGFDHVFSNDLEAAKEQFASGDSAPHLMGLGCIVFLQAALGMEVDLINEANRLLTLTEAKARKEYKSAKTAVQTRRFPPGLDFEVLQADSMLLLGLVQALSAHSKFTKIYNTAFPDGVNNYATPSSSPGPSRKPSNSDINRSMSLPPLPISVSTPTLVPLPTRVGFFSRWNSSSKVPSVSSTPTPMEPDGPIEELIIAGAAFGYGLFNLVISLLPPKIRGVVGFLGFKSDRQLALRALAVAATKNDAHAVFAGLTLMTYHGAVLLLSGYQADEAHIFRQYKAIVNKLQNKYPLGSLWILNNAKILSLSGDSDGAIAILKAGLSPQRSHNFRQADALVNNVILRKEVHLIYSFILQLVFELAWTLFSQRKYEEAAQMFLKMTEINTWSHATYYYLAAGCLISIGDHKKGQELLDQVPCLMEKRKLAGRELPTEILIKNRIAFYKAKQLRRKGLENQYAQCIHLSIAEVWNVHHRISAETAEAHIRTWISVSPQMTIEGSHIHFPSLSSKEPYDLDTADELALRSLLLGVVHKSLNRFNEARTFLMDVVQQNVESKWYKVLALFEMAVIRLRETDYNTGEKSVVNDSHKDLWDSALKDAVDLLNRAAEISATTEVSSRIESRISMLRDEIALKRQRVFGI
ncbi:hypothetical protein Clacol_006305 [Clathrus columnatus]|uniref:Tetratricopeptide repeat protein 39C n=1 Tax=Clathrus columnatus TaxID=1419009 RepID=A0AAV5AFV3_9AGAM|nr:hypothetical protein Clacol_006305 [Clathrus columnatus]